MSCNVDLCIVKTKSCPHSRLLLVFGPQISYMYDGLPSEALSIWKDRLEIPSSNQTWQRKIHRSQVIFIEDFQLPRLMTPDGNCMSWGESMPGGCLLAPQPDQLLIPWCDWQGTHGCGSKFYTTEPGKQGGFHSKWPIDRSFFCPQKPWLSTKNWLWVPLGTKSESRWAHGKDGCQPPLCPGLVQAHS